MKEIQLFDRTNNKVMAVINADNEMVSLTDLWKAAGSPANEDPRQWVRLPNSDQLIETLGNALNVEKSHIIKSKKGKGGGTWGHKSIALAYAKYLDPVLHIAVNEVFFQRVEEEKNPDLIADRYMRTYERKGKTPDWIAERFEGRLTRNEYTSCLKRHGVDDRDGYRNCTNAIYAPLFGGSTAVVREKKGIEKGINIRDNLSKIELAAVKLSEMLATDNIDKNNLHGSGQCEIASHNASRAIANAIIQSRTNTKTKSII